MMEQQLKELELKQRKLIFMLGEKLFDLLRTDDVRFRYTADGIDRQKEVDKLLTLMNYLEDRIEKLDEQLLAEEYSDEDDGDDEDAAAEEAEEAEEVEQNEESGSAPEPLAAVVLAVPCALKPLATAVAQEAPVALLPEEPEQEVIVKVDRYDEDQVNRVVEEEVATEAAVPIAQGQDVLENILLTAEFTSDADKRIFENNLKQLKSGEEREREFSIGQIAHISTRSALRRAYEFLLQDPSIRIRLAVIKSVSRMKDADTEGYFELGLADTDEKVRVAALKGLGTHVSARNRAILERLLKDSNEHIRGLAVTYLGIYYGKEGVVRAIASRDDESAYVRISLIELLTIVKPDGSLKVMKEFLSDKSDDVKKAAEKALARIMPARKKAAAAGR